MRGCVVGENTKEMAWARELFWLNAQEGAHVPIGGDCALTCLCHSIDMCWIKVKLLPWSRMTKDNKKITKKVQIKNVRYN